MRWMALLIGNRSKMTTQLRDVKLVVTAILEGDEFGMASLFGNPAALDHDDMIGIGDGC